MRASRGMAFCGADLLHGVVRDGEINFASCLAGLPRIQTELPEEALRHPVVPLVLYERAPALGSQPGFSAMPDNEPHLLERRNVTQGGRRSDMKRDGRDLQ